MRVVAIVGSSRRGNTYNMVEAACHALEDFDIELIHLQGLDIAYCDGCLSCDQTGRCRLDDDMGPILHSMKQADGFIIGTPARWSLLSGELKAFIDRLNPLAVPQLLKGKAALILAVGQSEGEEAESIRLAAESVRYFCDNAGIQVADVVLAEGCVGPEAVVTTKPDVLDQCRTAARTLAKLLESRG